MSERTSEYLRLILYYKSVSELAADLGVSESTVRRWVNRDSEPTPAHDRELSRIYAGYRSAQTRNVRNPDVNRFGTEAYKTEGMTTDEVADLIESLIDPDADPTENAFRLIFATPPTPEYPNGRTPGGWFLASTLDRDELESMASELSNDVLYVFKGTPQ